MNGLFRDQSSRRAGGNASGFTLIEILLVLALLTTVLAGVVGLIATMQRRSELVERNLLLRNEIRRFADEMRHDFHSSQRGELTDQSLVLFNADETQKTIYKVDSDSTIRRITEGSSTGGVGRSIVGRDRYEIGNHISVDVRLGQDGRSVRWSIKEVNTASPAIEIVAVRNPNPPAATVKNGGSTDESE